MIELPVEFLVHHLQIREGRKTPGAPVDEPLPPVDEPLVVEAHEDLQNGPGEALVQCKTFALPVAGAPQGFELLADGVAVLLPPGPAQL